LKIKFDGNQPYQLDAIDAVVNLFEGQPLREGAFSFSLASPTELLSELGLRNALALDDAALLANLHKVQAANELPESAALDGRNFSVEVETGTGKTYVYLRSIFELHQRYGFAKFIIVVPSVAIREGVTTSLDLMETHFRTLYDNVAYDRWVYDSRQFARLRQFAQSTALQIMVMNIDSFNKQANNVIYQEKDQLSGRRPIEFVQAARPLVTLDEPQNMASSQAKQAIASLNPLCTLRYSATHRHAYNLVYKLDPLRAYDLKLVKRIQVSSVLDDPDFNQPYIQVQGISATKTQVSAKLLLDVNDKAGPKRKPITISTSGVDLRDKTNGRENYTGYIVDEINAADGFVSFTNGLQLFVGQSHGGRTDEVMRVQIRETVKEHLDKELQVARVLPPAAPGALARMKVLSLFFIDRVANYVAEDGKIRYWFIAAYQELAAQAKYQSLNLPPVEQVHNGYFSAYKNVPKDTRGDTSADDEAYHLIMQAKQKLLLPEVPLRFIFSHSALREGWDNPNVFQICTLNETKSEVKKRQEIGRGLRLPVLATGERCFDESINKLTVVANEHYDEFARQLQQEMADDFGINFTGRIVNKREVETVLLVPGWQLNADFLELWNRIKPQTRYAVQYSTAELIRLAAKRLAAGPKVAAARINIEKTEIKISAKGVDTQLLSVREASTAYQRPVPMPDLLAYLQAKTELTRKTLAEILIQSGRLDDAVLNPQQFLEQAHKAIDIELKELMVAGIKYERIENRNYEMLLFEQRELSGALTSLLPVNHSIYDTVLFDSEVERSFAKSLSERTDIKMFVKLPGWFKIETPIGTYNPDWAIVKEEDEKLYLVRETKSNKEEMKLRGSEWAKIQCGQAHFDALNVDFAVAISATEI